MLPVHCIPQPKDKQPVQWPTDNICYCVGSNGIFKRVSNDFYEVISKLEGIPKLASIDANVRLKIRKLPYTFVEEAAAFFSAVYSKHKAEAVVLLYSHPKYGWYMDAPKQEVVGLHVDYDPTTLPTEIRAFHCEYPPEQEGGQSTWDIIMDEKELTKDKEEGLNPTVTEFAYQRFGTIHSHASASAFHSGTDDKDEEGFDGLHITIGNVDVTGHSYSARWQLAGKFYKCTMQDAVEDPPTHFFDERWLQRVTQKVYQSTVGSAAGSPSGASSHHSGIGMGAYGGRDYGDYDGWGMDDADYNRYHGRSIGGPTQPGETFRTQTPSTTEAVSANGNKAVGATKNATPEHESRLQVCNQYLNECKTEEQRKTFFESLANHQKRWLMEDLVRWYPTLAANFQKGLGADFLNSTGSGSDTSLKNGPNEKELITSPTQQPSEKATPNTNSAPGIE